MVVDGVPWPVDSDRESLGQFSTQQAQLMHRSRSRVNLFCARSTSIAPVGHLLAHKVQYAQLSLLKINSPRDPAMARRGSKGYCVVGGLVSAHFKARRVIWK